MRFSWILLVLAVFTAFLTRFLIINQSPFEKDPLKSELENQQVVNNQGAQSFLDESFQLAEGDQYINTANLSLLLLFASVSLVSFVASIHSIIDKLFFKKFYENPNYFVAIRRGILLDSIFLAIIALRLFGLLELVTGIAVVLLLILIELTFTSYSRKNSKASKVETPKSENVEQKENK